MQCKQGYKGKAAASIIADVFFFLETSLDGFREITNSRALDLVLLLHVCLMECSENSRMKQKLIECGCVNLLLKELRNMTRYVQADAHSNKVSH